MYIYLRIQIRVRVCIYICIHVYIYIYISIYTGDAKRGREGTEKERKKRNAQEKAIKKRVREVRRRNEGKYRRGNELCGHALDML